ncbi:DNA repair protein Rad9,Rhp9 [Desmophyllum pertusum]|uniref:DNA repair protein Rad9,Rhp9 n=1 Tax=Desmophyllum pertusum TaxID=174260 RepID=A0A9W9Z788_9CNID|nr:DNA repair protein Rad9,Rhp9 [Desmophyllum pertusum]
MPEEIRLNSEFLVLALIIFTPVAAHNYVDGSSGLKRGVHVQGNRVSYGNFAVDKFHRLQVSVGSSSIVSTYRECALSCVNNPPCSSFNVGSSPRSDGKFRCELLNEDKYTASPGQLVSSSSYHHYSIKTPCSSWPCKNGAKCIPNYEHGGYSCNCHPGYTGKTCQTEIDECSSNPCKNGATCKDHVNRYTCQCAAGFRGYSCNKAVCEDT